MKAKRPMPDRAQLRARIREAGMRCTTARVAVLEQLERSTSPMSHAEVADKVSAAGYDRATVYRNLIELAEVGIVSRVDLGDHVWRFEARAPHTADHPHFLCTQCGEVACLDDVTIQITPSPGSKRSPMGEINEVLLKGLCRKCG